MLNGLDLFSGIGGISFALREWVRPVAYCEIDPYCQGIILSRISDGSLLMRQFGMISKRCRMMGEIGPESTSFMEDFHARTLVLQELKKAYLESEVPSSSICSEWLVRLNLSFYSLKTFPKLSKSVELKSLKKLTRWGWTAVGRAFLPQVVEHHIGEIGGFFWPTLTASQAGKPIRKPSLSRILKIHGYDIQDRLGQIYPQTIGKKINPHFLEWMMGFPMNWTELGPWVMQWYQNKRNKPSKY